MGAGIHSVSVGGMVKSSAMDHAMVDRSSLAMAVLLRYVQTRGSCSSSINKAWRHAHKGQEPLIPFEEHTGKPLPQADADHLRWTKVLQERNFQQKGGMRTSVQLLLAELKACSRTQDLQRVKTIHGAAVECGHGSNIYLMSTLVRMYAKCGSIVDARRVFDSIQNPDVVAWTALLMGYAENGKGDVALDLFCRMKASGCLPNCITYVAAFKACTSLAVDGDGNGKKNCLERGRQLHSEIGSNLNHYVQSTLIDMYAKCSSMVDARRVFDSIQKPDVVCWNALLLGYAENGEGLCTLDLFSMMRFRGFPPDGLTYVAALKACGLIGALALGRKLHSEIREFSAHVVTCLVDFYGKCGSMIEAREVFNRHPKARDVTTWNALLGGYGSFGDTDSVFGLFDSMQDKGFRPNAVTFVSVLSSCSHGGLVEKAREYFEGMDVRYRVTPTVRHYSCMVDVLGRANLLNEAVGLLQKMPCSPDAVTWMALLSACHKWKNVEIGRMAFQSLVSKGEKVDSAHVLMAQIYGSKGMLVEEERVLEARMKIEAPGQADVLDEVGKLVKFVDGEQGPPEVEQIMQEFCEHGYASDVQKEKALCGLSERRAVVFGILKTPSDEPIRVFKNTRMCDDCHGYSKMVSKLSGRVVMVRDARRFHVIENGNCSCKDYW